MAAKNYYVAGQWNAVCDRCGVEYKSAELLAEWTGLRVCRKCWEPRHPQDLLRVPTEDTSVPWSRPEGVDTFIDPYIMEEDPYAPDALITELGIPINME